MSTPAKPTAPGGQSAAAAAMIAAQETVLLVWGTQVLMFALGLVVVIPSIYVWIVSGRIKSGFILMKSKGTNVNLSAAPNPNKDKVSPAIFVLFRRAYNASLLRTIPFINLTIGQILVLQGFLGLVGTAQVYSNFATLTMNFRRPGSIATVCLPLLFGLAMKNTPFGILGKGYERVNFFHRFVGRIITLLSLAHYGLWAYPKLKDGKPIFVFQGAPLTGMIALSAFLLMVLTSFKFFRSRFYQAFLVFHVTSYPATLGALWYHKETLRPFVAAASMMILTDILLGLLVKTYVRPAIFTSMSGGLTNIKVERVGDGWRAGQHVYLRVLKGRNILEKHPFTIANAPSSVSPLDHGQCLVLVAKATGRFTKRLRLLGGDNGGAGGRGFNEKLDSDDKAEISVDSDYAKKRISVAIEGPYGSFYTDLARHGTVVLIAGGSGFTYVLSTLEDIVGSFLRGKSFTTKVYVVWALRSMDLAEAFAVNVNETLDIARQAGLDVIFRVHMSTIGDKERSPIFISQVIQGRIDSVKLITEVVDSTALGRNGGGGPGVGVGVCGPVGLITSVRNAVAGANEAAAGGISVHSEMFGM